MTPEEEIKSLRAEVKHIRAALRSRMVVLVEYMTDEGWGWDASLLGLFSTEGGALVDVLAVARNGEARPVLIRPMGFGGTWIVQALRPRYDHVTRYYMRDGQVTPVEVRLAGRRHLLGGHWRIRRTEVNP